MSTYPANQYAGKTRPQYNISNIRRGVLEPRRQEHTFGHNTGNGVLSQFPTIDVPIQCRKRRNAVHYIEVNELVIPSTSLVYPNNSNQTSIHTGGCVWIKETLSCVRIKRILVNTSGNDDWIILVESVNVQSENVTGPWCVSLNDIFVVAPQFQQI